MSSENLTPVKPRQGGGLINVAALGSKKIQNSVTRAVKHFDERVDTYNSSFDDVRDNKLEKHNATDEKLLEKTPSMATNNSQK